MPDRGLGNEAQTRAIAEQLFAVWEQKQSDGATKQRASWPAWLGLALAIFTLVFSAGTLRADVSTHNERITKAEHRLDQVERGNEVVTDRLARIETKLDLILEKKGGGK